MKEVMKYVVAVGITALAMFAYLNEPRFIGEGQKKSDANDIAELAKEQIEKPVLSESQRQWNLSQLAASLNSLTGRQYNTREFWEKQRIVKEKAERAYFDRVSVEPWNPESTRCYEEEESNDGTLQCESTWKYPRHHYYSASTKELIELAYTDALAATIAAKRIEKQDGELSFKLRMHAAVLSDKPGPLVDAAYSIRPQFNADLEAAESDYVFFALINIATKMGYEHNDPEYTPTYFSLDLEKLAEYTKTLAIDLAQLQSTISGSTNLKELFDV